MQSSYKDAEPLVNLFAGFKKVSRPKVVPIFPKRADGTAAMTDHASDGQIDRLVKARWLAIGLSQSDLAEVLGAANHAAWRRRRCIGSQRCGLA